MPTTDTAEGNGPTRSQRSAGRRGCAPWAPLSGDALLDRVRFTGRARLAADPTRPDRLRRLLDPTVAELASLRSAATSGSARLPLVVTSGWVARAAESPDPLIGATAHHDEHTPATACGALMTVLFRQLVTVGSFDDPISDGLEILALDGRGSSLCRWIDQLDPSRRQRLVDEVQRQARDLAARWPAIRPEWLPRTGQTMRALLVGGDVALTSRADLALGRTGLDRASVALIDVTSGGRHPEHRHHRHFAALVEAIRHPAPPFAVATYYTRTGELDVDPVDDDLLDAAVLRVTDAVRQVTARSTGPTISALPSEAARPPSRPASRPAGQPGRNPVGDLIGTAA